jgi:hypothetical protein
LTACHVGQREGGQHKNDSYDRRHFPEKCTRSTGAENGLAGTTEGGAHVRSLASLEQNDQNQCYTGQNVQNRQECRHFLNFPFLSESSMERANLPPVGLSFNVCLEPLS